jgi:hypothetical protein
MSDVSAPTLQPTHPDDDDDGTLAALAVSRVLTCAGEPVTMRTYWEIRPTLTCFLRHFGCLFCHEMAHEVQRIVPDVVSLGAQVILIGNGSPAQAQRFFSHLGLQPPDCVLLTDPERESFDRAGLRRSFARTFLDPAAHKAYVRARSEGHRITGAAGNINQLGGVFVTRPPVRLVWSQRSRFAGDHPSGEEMLRAVAEACST